MPKNNADPKKDRADNRADKKNSLQNYDNPTEEAEAPMLNIQKAADYAPSLNGISKNDI